MVALCLISPLASPKVFPFDPCGGRVAGLAGATIDGSGNFICPDFELTRMYCHDVQEQLFAVASGKAVCPVRDRPLPKFSDLFCYMQLAEPGLHQISRFKACASRPGSH